MGHKSYKKYNVKSTKYLKNSCYRCGNELFKSIEDIKIGDEVVTAYGNMQLVENLLRYDVKEKIITIESANEKVKLTSDHKMLAIKPSQCTKEWQDRSKLPVVCKKGCSLEEKCINKPYEEYEAEWIEANKLEKNDFILYPRTKADVRDITYDLLDYPLSLKVGERRYLKIFGYYK